MAAIPLLLYHEKIGENFNPQEVGNMADLSGGSTDIMVNGLLS